VAAQLPAVPPLPAKPPVTRPPVIDVPSAPAPLPGVKLPNVPPPPRAPVVPSPSSPLPLPTVPPPTGIPTVSPPVLSPPAAVAPAAPPSTSLKPPVTEGPLPVPTPLVEPARPSVGSVVVLQDGKLVEGVVTKTADKVLVRKGTLDQPFPKGQVQYIGESRDDVYRYMLGKVQPDDAAGRFKLARWCMFNGLREQALTEAREVVKLQPNHTAAAQMARALDESLRLFPPDGSPARPAAPAEPTAPAAPGLPAVPPPGGLGTPPAVTPPTVVEPEPDVTPEGAVTFAPRVQPILANLCADCHGRPSYTGAFKLAKCSGYESDPHTARHNLRAAAGQIKKDDPASSPLLQKALVAHGEMKQPAFANRGAPAFRVLEAWVFVAAGSPSAPAPAAVPPPVPAAPPPVASPAPCRRRP
jgi:hypothetical protein